MLDAVDKSVSGVFYENVDHMLNGRPLDYVIVNHVEPDHSASLEELIMRHPEAKVVGSKKIKAMVKQYVTWDVDKYFEEIKEGRRAMYWVAHLHILHGAYGSLARGNGYLREVDRFTVLG